MIERRYITSEFRVSDPAESKTTIFGYAAVFESPTSNGYWTETLDPHCFDAVLASNPDVRALWNHNADHVLGRTTSNTLTLALDARGLSYTIDPPETTIASDLLISMRRKDVTGSSFGFVCKRDQWTDNLDGTITRHILEIGELLDVSPVTYPFYGTSSATVRSLPNSIPESIPMELRSRLTPPQITPPVSDDWAANTDILLKLAAL